MRSILFVLMIFTVIASHTLAEELGNCPEAPAQTSDAALGDLAPLVTATDEINTVMAADANEVNPVPEEVKRFELFRFEKDLNPKNILHYGMKVNIPSCTIAKRENGAPDFSNYWIMGEEDKRVKYMTKSDLKRLGPIVLSHDDHSVTFKMNAMEELPLQRKEITIEAKRVDNECKVTGSVQLDNGHKVDLHKIFAAISWLSVDYLDVYGLDRTTGEEVKLRFDQ